MDALIFVAMVVVYLIGLWALEFPLLVFDTRGARIWNCLSIGSAFAVLHFGDILQPIWHAGPTAKPWEWAGALLLATLFAYSAVLEVISWFSPME